MSQPSLSKRLWAFDVTNPLSPKLILNSWVTHGSGSDPTKDGLPTVFSNIENSNDTSLGLYKIGQRYVENNLPRYKLDGLTKGFNTNAKIRNIVFHPATYVSEQHVGLSSGCPAVTPTVMRTLDKHGLSNAVIFITDGANDHFLSRVIHQCAISKHSTSVARVEYGIQRKNNTCSIPILNTF